MRLKLAHCNLKRGIFDFRMGGNRPYGQAVASRPFLLPGIDCITC